MHDFHSDVARYFNMQYLTAKEYIIPFIETIKPINSNLRILEVGCAEAGVLLAFIEKGCTCYGIELSASRTALAKSFHEDAIRNGKLTLINKNVYDINPQTELGGKFDIIILKDVIEHIPHQEKFIPVLKDYLTESGIIFFGFPPWQMPYGGHQQVSPSKVISKLPWTHLLPMPLYKQYLKWFSPKNYDFTEFLEIKETGISTERFESICNTAGFKIVKKQLYVFNPIYKYKFGLNPVSVMSPFDKLNYIKNYYSTCAYYIIGN